MKYLLIAAISVVLSGCSVPVLDSPACLESRGILKNTYSVYIDSFEKEKSEKLKLIEERLSDEIKKKASAFEGDFLTRSKKAVGARVGNCIDKNEGTTFEVKVFIKIEDEKPSENNLLVGMKKFENEWKVASVEPRD